VQYDRLTADDLVVLDLSGEIVEGKLRPSSDTKTHLVLYRAWKGIGGVGPTHSSYATGFAQARLPIPIFGTTHADHLAEDVPCTAIMSDAAVDRDYELETGNQILEVFERRDPLKTPMVLVAGHGAFSWGETPEKAVYHAAVLEELAKMAFVTRTLDPHAARLPERLIEKHFARKHGKDAYYGQKQ
jgi:L-ribulose-5-phosphate 4-epimerase